MATRAMRKPGPGDGALLLVAGVVVLLLAIGWVRRGTWLLAVPSLTASVLMLVSAGANLRRALATRR